MFTDDTIIPGCYVQYFQTQTLIKPTQLITINTMQKERGDEQHLEESSGKAQPELDSDEEAEAPVEGGLVCTPYEFSNTSGKEVDYNKLIEHFGTKPLTPELLERFEKATGHKPHIYLRRGTLSLT